MPDRPAGQGSGKRKAPAQSRGRDTSMAHLTRRPIHVDRHKPPVTLAGRPRAEPVALEPPPPPARKPRPKIVLGLRDRPDDASTGTEPLLDGDCTAADLKFAFAHVHFTRDGICTLKLDRDVIQFIIHALGSPRAARPHR